MKTNETTSTTSNEANTLASIDPATLGDVTGGCATGACAGCEGEGGPGHEQADPFARPRGLSVQ